MGTTIMKKIFTQIIRGCGDLPYVGEHPGTPVMILMMLAGGGAGIKGGMSGFLAGICFMAVFILPIYLYGAWDRAELSDVLQKENE
jgi:hypothetical protein